MGKKCCEVNARNNADLCQKWLSYIRFISGYEFFWAHFVIVGKRFITSIITIIRFRKNHFKMAILKLMKFLKLYIFASFCILQLFNHILWWRCTIETPQIKCSDCLFFSPFITKITSEEKLFKRLLFKNYSKTFPVKNYLSQVEPKSFLK